MTERSRRVGTLTMGISLIFTGSLFAAHLLIPETLSYSLIFKLWPIILILLGAEVLFANLRSSGEKIIYDGGAIFLMVLMVCFSAVMAGCQILLDYGLVQGHIVL